MHRADEFFFPLSSTECLYDHINPKYKFYVRINEITSIVELQVRVRKFEDVEEEKREAQKRKERREALHRRHLQQGECCWRCKQWGYTFF